MKLRLVAAFFEQLIWRLLRQELLPLFNGDLFFFFERKLSSKSDQNLPCLHPLQSFYRSSRAIYYARCILFFACQCFVSSLGENVSAENLLKYNIILSCLLQTNSIDGTVPEEVMFQSDVKKLQQEQFRPAEQVSISSQEMLQYIVLE
ncbi:unnamed protein product [Brassica oleracea]